MSTAFHDPDILPWTPHDLPDFGAYCNICRWTGMAFATPPHVEGNACPSCNSISRDRHLHLTWTRHWEPMAWAEVLETSPRIGGDYRQLMTRQLRYRGSDYDQRAHRADIQADLQDIDLPDGALDVILSAHVLEHVPDTDRALSELRRVLAPGGMLVLQIPLLEPSTIVPRVPEFHGDDTPVFWRFGLDLTDRLEQQGFDVTMHVPQALADAFARGRWNGPGTGEFDLDAVIRSGHGRSFDVVGDAREQYVFGFGPGYGIVTWTCRVPGTATPRPAPSADELAELHARDEPPAPAPASEPAGAEDAPDQGSSSRLVSRARRAIRRRLPSR